MNRQWDEFEQAAAPGVRIIDSFDPRLRVIALFLFAAATVFAREEVTLAGLALVSSLLLVLARFSLLRTLRRILPLMGFGLVLACVLPWTVPGQPLGPGWFANASWEGLYQAVTIWARATIVLVGAAGLVGTLDLPVLGHVLAHWHVPRKLVQIVLLSIRYFKVLEDEYHRLHTAVRMRGFRPAWNWWTFHTYGQMVGMLIVRSLARSDRILAAMKCRGFKGYFYLWRHFHFSWRDIWFVAALSLAGLAYLRVERLL
ncbi:cobalt ECF transporter T component CbiQ [Thermogutta sp.]|uniref:cobalt ECF transporter T component CbiQ n=1 Tax=Thermogutta sp. TaxID=1962930 RepID=UPI00321FBF39